MPADNRVGCTLLKDMVKEEKEIEVKKEKKVVSYTRKCCKLVNLSESTILELKPEFL